MVRSHVQDNGNFGPEALDGLQLKAGNFEDNQRARFGALGERDCGCTDVAADQSRKSRSRQNLTRERGCRCLTVGASDRNNGARQELGGEFDFADHRFAKRASLDQGRSIHGNSRADHNQVLSAKV